MKISLLVPERQYLIQNNFYLWVPKVELSLARIKERVAKGGHNVPTQDPSSTVCSILGPSENFLVETSQQGLQFSWHYILPARDTSSSRESQKCLQTVEVGQDVKRRFAKSFDNFQRLYKPLADYWSIIENAVIAPQLIARGIGDKVEIMDHDLYESILK